MSRKDILLTLIIGEVSALFGLVILKNIKMTIPFFFLLPILLPILATGGFFVVSLISKKITIIRQLAKFVLVGILNTTVDLGVLNLLMMIFQISSGTIFIFFKAISSALAVLNSFFWNKFWVFQKSEKNSSKIEKEEFSQFLVITLIGLFLNLSIAYFVVNIIKPQLGLSSNMWANVGAISATLICMTWNFLGYRFIVFK